MKYTNLTRLVATFALACAATGCAAPLESEDALIAEASEELFAKSTKWATSSDGITYIPVCWYNVSDRETEKQYVRSAVTGAWEAFSSIRFTGWGACSGSPSGTLRIHNYDVSGGWGYYSSSGSVSSGGDIYLNLDYDVFNPNIGKNCDIFGGSCDHCHSVKSYCIGVTALHEFGHGVGMYHEQQRFDNTDGQHCNDWDDDETRGPSGGIELTSDYDNDSIMSYCSEWDRSSPHISKGDAYGIEARYGSKPNKLTNQVLLYSDQMFAGDVQALYPGSYSSSSSLGIGNDALSSIRIPSGFTVTLYKDANYGGSSVTLTSDTPSLEDLSFNDVVTSIKVTGPSSSFPVIYKDSDHSGSSQTLRPGVYSSSGDLTIGNDAVSSISVPSGWTVTLYKDSNFGGSSVTYTSSASSLGSFNDETTSIKVTGPSGWNPVVVYKNANYTGEGHALWPGRYESGDLGIGGDNLSSLTIPTGWTVYLLKDAPSYGKMRVYTSSQSTLSGDDFNDETSAIVIEGPTS